MLNKKIRERARQDVLYDRLSELSWEDKLNIMIQFQISLIEEITEWQEKDLIHKNVAMLLEFKLDSYKTFLESLKRNKDF